ncbi:MAG: hypothetical protein JSU86_05040 [Phycisphaerales bacterium]|nr:MAG: hypothetical protein JSU86_05040 [Phycisphaerales bacterium]
MFRSAPTGRTTLLLLAILHSIGFSQENKNTITGARQVGDPGHFSYGQFDAWEKRLLDNVHRPDGPEEVYGLLTAGYWGDKGQRVVEVRGPKAVLCWYSERARSKTRLLSPEETEGLRRFVDHNKVDELPPLVTNVRDGIQYEYVHFSGTANRRVFMNNPGVFGTEGSVYNRLTRLFERLTNRGSYSYRYEAIEAGVSLKLVFADDKHPVQSVWAEGNDVRVLIGDGRHGPLIGRTFADGRLGRSVTMPIPSPKPWESDWGDVPSELNAPPAYNLYPWQVQVGESRVRTGSVGEDSGLWLCGPENRIELVSTGHYRRPVASPDGRWVVAGKHDDWRGPGQVVRVGVASGMEHIVPAAPADQAFPVAYLLSHLKMLVVSERYPFNPHSARTSVGPDEPIYYLLDVATGICEQVSGEFRPLRDLTYRPLQSAGTPHEFWAAVYDKSSDKTAIGRYDTKSFSFQPLTSVPTLRFSSMNMWVDEPRRKAFIVYNGHLLVARLEGSRTEP